jgi:hypothetical protein
MFGQRLFLALSSNVEKVAKKLEIGCQRLSFWKLKGKKIEA